MPSHSLPGSRSSLIRPSRSSCARSRCGVALLTLLTLLLIMWPCALVANAAPVVGMIGQPRPHITKPLAPSTLTSITVTPTDPSIVVGITQQFTATGNYSDGSTQDLTNNATWTSSDMTVATISSSGLATALKSGSTTITASFDPGTGVVSGSTGLTVTSVVLTSIAVTPTNPSIVKGTTQQFTATGTFSDGSTQDLTDTVQWSSSSTGVATISSSGVATAVNTGSTSITATSGTVSGSTTLTVTAATLTSITLSPTNLSIPNGLTQQFVATGTYSDGTTQNISNSVSWSSSDPTVATISSSGLATTKAAGTTTITATDTASGISGTTTLTVTTATLVSIAVTPANPTIAKGTTQQFVATGTYSDGSTIDISSNVTWSSNNTTVATISSTGLATGVKPGITTITATSGSVSGTTSLIVTAATLTSITLAPPTASISAGTTRQYIATGTYSDGHTQDISSSVTWKSSNPGVATISDASGSKGLATGKAPGATNISATDTASGVKGTAPLLVTAATLTSIAVTPSNSVIAKGQTQLYSAIGTFSDGSTQDLTTNVEWTSSDTGVAIFVVSGKALGVNPGSTTVTASTQGVSGTAILNVTAAVVTSISIAPGTATIANGTKAQYVATGTFSDGTSQVLTSVVNWTTGDTAIATISNVAGTKGRATGTGVGTTTITAELNGVSGSASIIVTNAVLHGLAITPAASSILKGQTQQFTATGTFSDGTVQDVTNSVQWASTLTFIATIDQTGLATGINIGGTLISATYNTLTVYTQFNVVPPPVVRIVITPQGTGKPVGSTLQFQAQGIAADGTGQDVTKKATWTSSDPSVATVSDVSGSKGIVTAVSPGTTTITATFNGVSGSTTFTVFTTVPPPHNFVYLPMVLH